MSGKAITHLIFDLGGVLIELNGAPLKSEWFSKARTQTELWECWLTSDAPKMFESGKLSEDAFAKQVIEELDLMTGKEELLAHFLSLPRRLFPGVPELLKELNLSYETALLSNSNPTHWQKKKREFHIDSMFDHHFASHLIGSVKPDKAIYRYVLDALDVPADHILFFDDNQLNVDAARRFGMRSEKVAGLKEVTTALKNYGVEIQSV